MLITPGKKCLSIFSLLQILLILLSFKYNTIKTAICAFIFSKIIDRLSVLKRANFKS
jgi:hypothetical protein